MTLRLVGHRETAATTAHHHRRRGRPKWLLIGLVVAMFCSVLLLSGLVRSQIGIDARGAGNDGDDSAVPASVSEGGPVIDLTHGRRQSIAMPPNTVALTFDDGPDPTWTPQVLGGAREVPRARARSSWSGRPWPATRTWSARSARRARRSACTRSPTRTSAEVSPDRVDREMTETQYALAGATGELSYLIRPPYSSEPDALDNARFDVISRLGEQGLRHRARRRATAWIGSGRASTRSCATRSPRTATAGWCCCTTRAATGARRWRRWTGSIPQMQRDGFTFTTVSAGARAAPANFPAGPVDLTCGEIMLVAVAIADHMVTALEWSLLLVGGLVVAADARW